jgi:prophage maintenance system killer protein
LLVTQFTVADASRLTSALLESLVQNHPSIDGNKPTASAVVDVFLRINGHAITADSVAS